VSVNISGTFKKDERDSNGLESIHDELVKRPLDRRIVVGMIETKFVKVDVQDGGVEVPTVRFVAIEPLTGPAATTARELLDAARSERTGQPVQPTLLDDIDDETDEVDDVDEPDLDEATPVQALTFAEPEL
jgi:hypothetical protein